MSSILGASGVRFKHALALRRPVVLTVRRAVLAEALDVAPGDYRVRNKRRYDAFLGTDLEGLLRNLGIESLLVTGVCTDICVTSTVQHARNLDFRCYVLRDGVAGTSPARHEAALLCLAHVFGYVIALDEVDTLLA